jgi:hypothetical protein
VGSSREGGPELAGASGRRRSPGRGWTEGLPQQDAGLHQDGGAGGHGHGAPERAHAPPALPVALDPPERPAERQLAGIGLRPTGSRDRDPETRAAPPPSGGAAPGERQKPGPCCDPARHPAGLLPDLEEDLGEDVGRRDRIRELGEGAAVDRVPVARVERGEGLFGAAGDPAQEIGVGRVDGGSLRGDPGPYRPRLGV